MSGLEVLGIVASAVQLAQAGIEIAIYLSNLCSKIRDTPNAIQERLIQIQQLIEIARLIERNPALQTSLISAILTKCLNQAEVLKDVLAKLTVKSTDGGLGKYWKAIEGVAREKKILRSLDRLEKEKCALVLGIANIDSKLLHDINIEIVGIQSSLTQVTVELPIIRKAVERLEVLHQGKVTSSGHIEDRNTSNERMIACLSSLAPADQRSYLSEVLTRTKIAFRWFFQTPDFKSWNDDPESNLLWVTASAGCGKTTLAAHTLKYVKIDSSPESEPKVQHIRLFFFFHKSNLESEGTATAALRSIISQFVDAVPSLLSSLLRRYDFESAKGNFTWSWEALWGVFIDMLHHMPKAARVSLILDAVDECEVSSREILLRNLASLNPERSVLKVFVTSRPHEQSSEIRSQYRHFEITNPETAADMGMLIVTRVGSFATRRHLSDDVERRIIDFLLANARGMFLWVVLVMEELERRDERLTDEVIALKLSRISITLVNTYKAMLENVSKTRKEDFWRITRWLLYGRRALSVAELETALSLELNIDRWHDFGGDVKFLCGSLISIDGPENTVNLVHQTAREFLETHLRTATPEETGEVDMDPIKSEVRLAKTCVQYLLQTSYAELTMMPSAFIISEYFEQMNVFTQDKPFLRYAIESWASHLQAVGKPDEVLWSSVLQLLSSQERSDAIMRLTYHFINRGNPCPPRWASPLHLAGYFNLPWLVEEYIRQGSNVNAIADMGDTPLVWASEKGSTECVKILLDAGAGPNKAEWNGWTPLHWAARAGHVEVANLLINAGANIHARDSKGATPVEWAIVRSHWDVVNSIDLKLQLEEFHKIQTIMRTQYGLHENQAIIRSSSKVDEE